MEQEFINEFTRLAATRGDPKSNPFVALHQSYALGNRQRAQEFLSYLRSLGFNLRGKRVLDIGSAYAGFTIASAAEGADAFGVEIDPELHRLGALNARGEPGQITLLEGDILDPTLLGQLGSAPFDWIILNDVFEHVYDSAALFERLAALSGPSSIIYFSIPNGDSYQSIEKEGHYCKPGLSLLPPSDWLTLVGPFNAYYRRFRHYQALFQSCGFQHLYLTLDLKALAQAGQMIPSQFAGLGEKLSLSAFDGKEALHARARLRLNALNKEIEGAITRKDWLALYINYGQYVWTGFATRLPHNALKSHPAMATFGRSGARDHTATRTVHPAVLLEEDFLDLSAAVIESQNGDTSAARVTLGDERRRACVTLTNENNPRLGDFTRWRLVTPANPMRPYLVCAFVKNDYENPSLHGRVQWSLAINGTRIHSEDIAVSAARRKLKALISGAGRIELELEVRTLCDCEPWHWGLASTTFIEGVMIQECPGPIPVPQSTSERNHQEKPATP